MRRIKHGLIWAVLAVAGCGGLVSTSGCSEENLKTADKIVADVNAVAQTLAEVPDSPAGPMIPAQVRAILELIGVVGAGAALGWQKVRGSQILGTLKAVAAGVERVEKADANVGATVKARIGEVMEERQIERQGRAIVNQAKRG